MHGNLSIPVGTLIAFLLVLVRVLGAFVFVPMPIKEAGPGTARIILALACTLALFSRWPKLELNDVGLGWTAATLLSEAALGVSLGIMVGLLSEALMLGAQALALQAGYGYASVIDPVTQADSDVLPVMAQLLGGILFFVTGLHRTVILAFASSLDKYPPGSFAPTRELASAIINVVSTVFSVGVRLAMPVIGLLLMTEISLALLGRINSQLHLGMHAFPVKMMLTMAVLGMLITVSTALYGGYAELVFGTIRRTVLR